MGSLMGGSSSSSSSGYSALSPALKAAFDPFGAAINHFTLPSWGGSSSGSGGSGTPAAPPPVIGRNGKVKPTRTPRTDPNAMPTSGGHDGVSEMFTPLGQTMDETKAFDMMRNGFTPTEDSIRRDTAMQMNPYMDSVIGEVNRQGQGQLSMMNQELSGAGQMGSNRDILGANDIDLSRMQTIGGLMGTQYNNALNNAMTVMPGQRMQDAQNLLGIGDFMRSLDTQTKQAPITALRAGTDMMAPFMSGGRSSQSQSNGIGSLLSAGATAYASDSRLKDNIKPLGVENGHNIYEFTYRGEPEKYIGVMADEVQKTHPEAVGEYNGYLYVDYDKIGVRFRAA